MEGVLLVVLGVLAIVGLVLFLAAAVGGPLLVISGVLRLFRGRSDVPNLDAEGNPTGGRPRHPAALIGGGLVLSGMPWAVVHYVGNLDFAKGRILRIRGRAQLPELANGSGWSDDATPRLTGLDAWQRIVLARAWLYSARLEHASVAAFARLSLRLCALAAPAALVERTHQAALDEAKHARRCFALASAFAGRPWTAGPLKGLERADDAADLPRLARGSLLDGVLAEGLAASVASEGARGALDPVIAETLRMIADEEAVHEALAWDIVRWTLEVGGSAVADVLAETAAGLDQRKSPGVPSIPGVTEAWLAEHGLPSQAVVSRLFDRQVARTRACVRELVRGWDVVRERSA